MREEFITKIRDILAELHTEEFYWSDMDLDWSPILQEAKDDEYVYGLDCVEVDGVSGSNSWEDAGFWYWDELPVATIQMIYNELSEYVA